MDQDMSYAGIHFRSDQLCAYAPSFGSVNHVDDIPEEMAGALARIRYLSARDQNSVDLLAGLGLQATLAVDPTLLERRVEVASSQNHSGNQVVIYGAPIGGEFLKALDQMAKRQRFEMSSIVYSQGSRVAHKPGVRADEFLRLFREARAVVTTTFHGTIFAILSGKPFAVVNAGAKINKISGLLKMFDAENRLVRDLDSLEDLLSQPLDAETVNAQLEKASAQSMEFLQNALN
jgi:polysaccharide pyruvyl transferase WcaK-like protein